MCKNSFSLLPLLCALLLLTSCSEYTNVLKSNDYEYRYEAAKALYTDGHYRQAAEMGVEMAEEALKRLGDEGKISAAE